MKNLANKLNTILILILNILILSACVNMKNISESKSNSYLNIEPIRLTPVFLGKPSKEALASGLVTEGKLETKFEDMSKDGITMVLFAGGSGETICFPSKVLKNPSKIDWYAKGFDLAEKYGMDVLLSGVTYEYDNLFNGKHWDPNVDLVINKKMFKELNDRYGSRSNFWGWYIPHEAGDRTHRGDIMILLRELPRFLKKLTPDKKVTFAPWFTSRITIGKDATTPAQCASNWDSMLSEIDGLDICAFQDTTAPNDEIGEWFSAVAPVFKKHGIELWSVVELFPHFQDKPGLGQHAISFPFLMEKMKAAAPYVSAYGCWIYDPYLNSKSKYPGAKELSKEYRKWLKNRNREK